MENDVPQTQCSVRDFVVPLALLPIVFLIGVVISIAVGPHLT